MIGAAISLAGFAYAQGPGGSSRGGYGMGGGHGMMGGGHGTMQGFGGWMDRFIPDNWNQFRQPQQNEDTDRNTSRDQERALREEIRGRREELASLLRSENPDRNFINQKTEELNRLEAYLDEKLLSPYSER